MTVLCDERLVHALPTKEALLSFAMLCKNVSTDCGSEMTPLLRDLVQI